MEFGGKQQFGSEWRGIEAGQLRRVGMISASESNWFSEAPGISVRFIQYAH